MTFRGSLYYRVPSVFPIIPWYSWPFGWSAVLNMTGTELSISGWMPVLTRSWRGHYDDIERVDLTLLGARFVFKAAAPMTFRTNEQDNLVLALKSHGIQIGVKEREVG